jgi:hypothetical protein
MHDLPVEPGREEWIGNLPWFHGRALPRTAPTRGLAHSLQVIQIAEAQAGLAP